MHIDRKKSNCDHFQLPYFGGNTRGQFAAAHRWAGLALLPARLYFLPTIIAVIRHHRQTLAIFVLNLLLGWTVLGWIGAFIWSLIKPAPTVQTVIVQQPPTIPS